MWTQGARKPSYLQANILKILGNKVWHIAHIEGKNHKQELYKFLRHYRATPHSSTGKAPAEVLFNRKFQVRLPQKNEPVHDPELLQQNQEAKAKQKAYKDAKTNTRPHRIKVGDHVLLLQKQTKTKPRYDPRPYKVTNVVGTQITAARGNTLRKRDAQRFKVITNPAHRRYGDARYPLNLHQEDTFTLDWTPTTTTTPQHPTQPAAPIPQHQYPNGHLDPNINLDLQRNQRHRQPPKRYNPQEGRWT